MKVSNFLLATLRETPSDAEVVSHQLMLRAGMIRKIASGLYTWMPLGLRVLRKVERIVREEMDKAGAQELLMPAVQPIELWEESGRWDQFGPQLLKLKDRHERDFCFGPTHEEVITDLIRKEIKSYKQLPANFYQIQTKFRDEVRPRFGVMRAREFLMKDAYSFHVDQDSLQATYDAMYETYNQIFTRLGLDFRPVAADTGAIGGSGSHEFHVLAESGEDAIAFSDSSDYAANVELAEALPSGEGRPESTASMGTVETPGKHSIEDVCEFLKVASNQVLKTLLVKGANDDVVALMLRGDHELNEVKAEKLEAVAAPLTFANAEEIKSVANCQAGSIGPVGLNITMIADHSALEMADFVCGANIDGKHLQGVNWVRDVAEPQAADLRNVVEGDKSPDGQGKLNIRRGIEVGHIFQLGQKYSQAMNATCLDENGKNVVMTMGCYGIGVSRIVASAIEQNNDDKGIFWPESIAPFDIALVPMNMQKSETCRVAAEKLYVDLTQAGFDVLFYDKKERAGVMFADMELIGIPKRIVISDRGLEKGIVEYKGRRDADSQDIPLEELLAFLKG